MQPGSNPWQSLLAGKTIGGSFDQAKGSACQQRQGLELEQTWSALGSRIIVEGHANPDLPEGDDA